MVRNFAKCIITAAWVIPAVAVVGLLVQPAQAGKIRLGSVLPGGALIYKNIISMREARYSDLIEQETDFSCGAAALATILKYAYSKNLSEEDVLRGMMEISDQALVRRRGFSLLDIKRYVQALGLRGRGYKLGVPDLANIKIPTIVLLDIKGYKHFVVLQKATRDKVYVADPALGNKVMPINDFAKGWNGVVFAVIGQGFDRNSVLLTPSEPLRVRRMALKAPITDAELLDFGFTYTDLF